MHAHISCTVDAIIFLAPVGAFDQYSEEVRKSRRLSTRAFSPAQADGFYDSQDPKKSRLEEAFNLWQSLVENKLLARVPIILILSKIDLLKKKLERGVQLREHMSSYRQPNDYEPVVQCAWQISLVSISYVHLACTRPPQPLREIAPQA